MASAEDAPLAQVPAPQPPLVARAPDQSSWLITVTPTADSGSAHHKSLRAQLWTKSGTAMQCANEWSDGTRTEDTVVGGTKIVQSLDGKGVHEYNPKMDPRYHDFSVGDFEKLDWITPESYVGAVNHAGERCYLFQTKGVAAGAGAADAGLHNSSLAQINTPPSPTSVYVSIRTGLPVEIDTTSDTYAFKFGAPGELRMPEVEPPAPPPPPAPSPPPSSTKAKKTPAPKAVKKSDPDDTTDL